MSKILNIKWQKFILPAFLAALLLTGIVLLVEEAQDLRTKQILDRQIEEILALSGAREIRDFHEQADYLRDFVHTNSVAKMDEEFYANWRDQTKLAGEFLAYLKGARKELPHMECSTRTGLLAHLYGALGYRTRSITVYVASKITSNHTFMEVRNPETGHWEIQDADYNVHWQHIPTGRHASVAEVLRDFKSYEPCGTRTCGWVDSAPNNRAPGLKRFMSMASIIDKKAEKRLTLYADGVDPEKIHEYNGRSGKFCDLIPKNCRQGFMHAASYQP